MPTVHPLPLAFLLIASTTVGAGAAALYIGARPAPLPERVSAKAPNLDLLDDTALLGPEGRTHLVNQMRADPALAAAIIALRPSTLLSGSSYGYSTRNSLNGVVREYLQHPPEPGIPTLVATAVISRLDDQECFTYSQTAGHLFYRVHQSCRSRSIGELAHDWLVARYRADHGLDKDNWHIELILLNQPRPPSDPVSPY